MISVGYLHKHSLDCNDFQDKQTYEFEVRNLLRYINAEGPIIFSNIHGTGWQGMTDKYDYKTLELIQYEP